VTVEYTMLDGVNDALWQAEGLVERLKAGRARQPDPLQPVGRGAVSLEPPLPSSNALKGF
jgi:hypothetical protein